MLQGYGIARCSQVGVERLTLPAATLAATVVADERRARNRRRRPHRRRPAQAPPRSRPTPTATAARWWLSAQQQAAQIQADARGLRRQSVYAKAYRADPSLYTTLRSLDAAGKVFGPNTTHGAAHGCGAIQGSSAMDPRRRRRIGQAEAMSDETGLIPLIRTARRFGRRARSRSIQSAAIAFRAAYPGDACVLGLLWLGSNFRIISSDSSGGGDAVRPRGADAGSQACCWPGPRPIERGAACLPGPGPPAQPCPVAALPAVGRYRVQSPVPTRAATPRLRASASPYLTGDGNVVLLDATLDLPDHRPDRLCAVAEPRRPGAGSDVPRLGRAGHGGAGA